MIVTTSAPGKLMLFGEHAILHGQPCLATAVDARIYVRATPMADEIVCIETAEMSFQAPVADVAALDVPPRAVRFIVIALQQMWQRVGKKFGMTITTRSVIQHSGLGSSSAVTVATVAALAHVCQLAPTKLELFEWSYAVVLTAQQGKGSGYDVATAVFGGTVYYDLARQIIEPLSLAELPLLVAYTGQKANTVEYIERVDAVVEREPEMAARLFGEIGRLTRQAKIALTQGEWGEIGRLMARNHLYLSYFDISTIETDFLVAAMQLYGAHGAKLSGAGGGDCVIAIAETANHEAIMAGIGRFGHFNLTILNHTVNAAGCRIDAIK